MRPSHLRDSLSSLHEGFYQFLRQPRTFPSFQGEASGGCSLLFTPHPFGKSACFSQEAGLQIMVGSVTVNPAPQPPDLGKYSGSLFLSKGCTLAVATICWVFPCYTESSPKSLSQLPALGKQASKSLSPDSFTEWEGCNPGGFPCCCTFSEMEGKIIPYFDSSVRVTVVWVYAVFSWHTMTFIKLPYIDLCNSTKSVFPKLA